MESSILTSTKKILGIAAEYTAFDLDIITHINATFGIIQQLGIGPAEGFAIEDDTALWEDLEGVPTTWVNMIRTYVFLRVKHLFDPPTTSFLLDATQKQIEEYEWRLSALREESVWTN